MTKIIELPAQQLSRLKKVHMSFDLTGKHYEMLASYDGGAPEQLVLSILMDCVKENVALLSRQEALYLFTLLRITSIDSYADFSYVCSHCGKKQTVKVNLGDVSINNPKKKYKIPSIEWQTKINEKKNEYSVLPLPLATEVMILDWFAVKLDISRDSLIKDKKYLTKYQIIKAIASLVAKDGSKVIETTENLNDIDDMLSFNDYSTVKKLMNYYEEVDNFGMGDNIQTVKCKGCGETNKFHLPMLYGLYNKS